MFKQVFLPILGCIAFIIAIGIFTQSFSGGKVSFFPQKASPTVSSANTKIVKVKGSEVKVEIAKSEKERQKGLSERTSLEENSGMLFVFDSKNAKPTFWMKEMSFAIDIIWIKDNKITEIDKNAKPEPGVADNKLQIYSPEKPVDYVLEVNAGYSDKNSLKVGDSVDLQEI